MSEKLIDEKFANIDRLFKKREDLQGEASKEERVPYRKEIRKQYDKAGLELSKEQRELLDLMKKKREQP